MAGVADNHVDELKKFINNNQPYFVFGILSLFLNSYLFSSGYILTLDTIFSENSFHLQNVFYGLRYTYSITPFIAFLNFLNIIIPVEFIQKASYFLIFFISGISAYRLCPEKWGTGRYYAGLLYMLNPFVYVRFLAGHWLLLLAYAVTPFVVKSFIGFLNNPSSKKAIYISIILTSVFFLETHTPFLLIMLFGVFLLIKLAESKNNPAKASRLLKSSILIGLFLLILNSYWLVPAYIGNSAPLGDISGSDLHTFTTKSDFNFNTIFTTASMYGFWRGGYTYTKDLLPYWHLFFVFILFLAVHGFVSKYRHSGHGTYVKGFGAIAVLSALLAAGISGPLAGTFEYLFNNIIIFKGFREPHKFVALLVLAYAYLGGLGVSEFERNVKTGKPAQSGGAYKKIAAWSIIALALSTPIIYSFTMFNGFWGQLEPTDYPDDWYEVNDYVNRDKQDFNILFLPWHAYMDFKWLPTPQKRIATPAYIFFDKPVIQGDNMEAGSIYSSSVNPVSRYIEFLFTKKYEIDNFGELVAPLNVKYIILTKEVDYRSYDFLYNQSDLELIKETENLLLFRNKHPVARIYQVDNINTIQNWDDMIEFSRSGDLTSSAFIIGNNVSIHDSEGIVLDYTVISSIKYHLEKPSKRYVVYSEKYETEWKLGGKEPIENFGVTNVYDTAGINDSILYYTRFHVYLTGYIISIIGFVTLAYFYFRKRHYD